MVDASAVEKSARLAGPSGENSHAALDSCRSHGQHFACWRASPPKQSFRIASPIWALCPREAISATPAASTMPARWSVRAALARENVLSAGAPPAGMRDLGDLPGGADFSRAFGINNAGQVAGSSGATGGTRAFRWTPGGGMQNLGVLPGFGTSAASAINNTGHVVGSSRYAAERTLGLSGGQPAAACRS